MANLQTKDRWKTETRIRPRRTEFTLGLWGGVLGLLSSVFPLRFASFYGFNGHASFPAAFPGVSAIIAAIVVWVTLSSIQYHAKRAGIILIVCALWGVASVFWFYIPAAVLLIIAGLMCLLRPSEINP